MSEARVCVKHGKVSTDREGNCMFQVSRPNERVVRYCGNRTILEQPATKAADSLRPHYDINELEVVARGPGRAESLEQPATKGYEIAEIEAMLEQNMLDYYPLRMAGPAIIRQLLNENKRMRERGGDDAINWKEYATRYEKVFSSFIGDGSKVMNLGDCSILIDGQIKALRTALEAAEKQVVELESRLNWKRDCSTCGAKVVDLSGYCSACDCHTMSSTLRDHLVNEGAKQMKAKIIERVRQGGFEYSDGDGLRDVDLRGLLVIAAELEAISLEQSK